MRKHLPYVIWILIICLVSYVGGQLASPGKIDRNPPPTISCKGRVCTHIDQPTAPQATNSPANGPVRSEPAPSLIMNKDGTQTLLISQLYELLDKTPTPVKIIIMENGSALAHVSIAGQPDAVVLVPDDGGKRSLIDKAAQAHVSFGVKPTGAPNDMASFLKEWGSTIFFVGLGIFFLFSMTRGMKQQMGQIRGMGKSRGKTVNGDPEDGENTEKNKMEKVGWDDVAGCDEAVTELKRLVGGLVGRDVYKKFGAQLPKGVLLVGPPGTGKTLLARVVANETQGAFKATSGSDFVEMLVGVGASRVRADFEEARKYVAKHKKPFVIFIDEIDAIGGKRGSGGINSNSEREQTLNALLVELDGVVGNEGIIIIAATNRPDMLDEALLRPGRFDCQVNVELPDVVGRAKIFGIHTKGKAPVAADVTPQKLAKISFSYSGAEIKGACNRAAFLAAEQYDKKCKELIAQGMTQAEAEKLVPFEIPLKLFDEGLTHTRFGDAATSKQVNMAKATMLNTAWHEGGHAITSKAFPMNDPVIKITIMRRSKALGYVQTMPELDTVGLTREQCIARIVMMMAGRAAQEEYLGTCDSGASNDFQQATGMARRMVMEWGMSDKIGRISIPRADNQFGGGLPGIGNTLADAVDSEVRRIVDACFDAAVKIVRADKARMEALVEYLMEHETMLGEDFAELCEKLPSNVKLEELNLPFWKVGEGK